MLPLLDCPGIECWQALFNDQLPPELREQCEKHLESCVRCQDLLDHLEEGDYDFRQMGRAVGDRTTIAQADPTLVEVVKRLLDGQPVGRLTPVDPSELHFLSPAGRTDILGTLGEYEVQEVLGQGGMGIVLKAFDPVLQRLVAIKVMTPVLAGSATARQRFIREAQAAACVAHEHIVAIHGVHEANGLPYLVMQYVAGESLQERLDREGPLEVEEIIRIGLETAQGLAAAHAQGLIHRDIKPANLLLEGEPGPVRAGSDAPRIKITDFGLARTMDDIRLTQNGVVAGTPEFMAPEQARGERIDHRGDLFSLGSVLYTLAAGSPPFTGSTPIVVLRQVSDQTPPPLRSLNVNIPVWLERLIARLMAKDADERFQSAAEVASLLEGCLAHLRQPATNPLPELPLLTSPGREGSWMRRYVGLLGLILLVVAGFGLLLLQPGTAAPKKEPSAVEFYQDFRGAMPPLSRLDLFGPNASNVTRFDDKGVRITLPGNRPNKGAVGIGTLFPVSGDFEITGTFEVLAAEQPPKGLPIGVALTAQSDAQLTFFARVGRFFHPRFGSVYLAEAWNKQPPGSFKVETVPTEARSGKVRLVRQGSLLRYLAADGDTNDFREFYQREFTAAEIPFVRMVVTNYDSPVGVDIRLVDLRIRARSMEHDPASAASPAVASPPRRWLAMALLVGLGILLVLAVWSCVRSLRRPARQAASEGCSQAIHFSCSSCGKKLKARSELVGRKVTCPHCRQGVLVEKVA